MIAAAVQNEGKYVLVRKIGERTERSVMAALTGFAKRHTELVPVTKKLRTATNPAEEGGVLVWVQDRTDQAELPLESKTTAAA